MAGPQRQRGNLPGIMTLPSFGPRGHKQKALKRIAIQGWVPYPPFYRRSLSSSQSTPSLSYWPERSLFSSGLLSSWTKYQQTTAGLEETRCQPRLELLISSQRSRENQNKHRGASSKQPERDHHSSAPMTHISKKDPVSRPQLDQSIVTKNKSAEQSQ